MKKEVATEIEYLKWFYQNADFGPADVDVKICLNERFEHDTRKKVPTNYRLEY